MHYVDAFRFVFVMVTKFVSFFTDKTTDVYSYNGTNKNLKVSKGHELQYWDFSIEWFMFMTSFGFYPDLKSIIAVEEEAEEVEEEVDPEGEEEEDDDDF